MNGFLTELLHVTLNLNLDGILLFHFLLVTYFIGVIISVRRPVGVLMLRWFLCLKKLLPKGKLRILAVLKILINI